jgi:Amt family ammonium transporter
VVLGLRPSEREEGIGMDVAQHGEEAYNRGEGAVLVLERRPTRGEESP